MATGRLGHAKNRHDMLPGSENHVVQIEDELADAALLSAQAALWSGATAVSRPRRHTWNGNS